MYSLLFLAGCSSMLCLILTPLCRNLFARLGVVDCPDDVRKLHRRAIPRVGGVPIAIAYLAAYGLLLLSPLKGKAVLAGHLLLVWRLLPAMAVIFAAGLIDDLVELKPFEKLLAQFAAATLAYWAGVRVLGVGSYSTDAWWWTFPLTILWLVGCTNAFNLIDGVDGLAAGVGLFSTAAVLTAALLQGNLTLAFATVPLAGCLLGFLRYNLHPASIFLGDSGSLLLGFLLGSYGVIWSQKSTTMLSMTAPLMAFGIPLLDAALSIARRFLRSDSIFHADRGHIHHRLLDIGFAPRKVTLTLYGVCGVFSALSLLESVLHNSYAGLVAVLFCGIAWLLVSRLGYVEFGAARMMLKTGLIRRLLKTQIRLVRLESSLLAAASAGEYWRLVREAAFEFGFCSAHLRIGDQVYEGSRSTRTGGEVWQLRVPVGDSGQLTLTRESQSSGAIAVGPFIELLCRILNAQPAGLFAAARSAEFQESLVRLGAHVGFPAPSPQPADHPADLAGR